VFLFYFSRISSVTRDLNREASLRLASIRTRGQAETFRFTRLPYFHHLTRSHLTQIIAAFKYNSCIPTRRPLQALRALPSVPILRSHLPSSRRSPLFLPLLLLLPPFDHSTNSSACFTSLLHSHKACRSGFCAKCTSLDPSQIPLLLPPSLLAFCESFDHIFP